MVLRYGKEVKETHSAFSNADSSISELLLRLENGLLRFDQQLHFAQRINHLMDQRHQAVYDRTLFMLQNKLELVKAALQNMTHPDQSNATKKIKYAWKKDDLEDAMKELEMWQTLTDQSWFLFMTILNPGVDAALAVEDSKAVRLIPSASVIRTSMTTESTVSSKPSNPGLLQSHDEVEKMEVSAIAFSEIKSAKRSHTSGRVTFYILDEISGLQRQPGSPFSRYDMARADTQRLASKLQHNEPETFGLLTCKCFTLSGSKAEPRITLVLRAPLKVLPIPRSLRDLLLNERNPQSLSQRFDIARGLAKSVGYVHILGFVHKNIRPESTLCFSGTDGRITADSVFLAGFDLFRRDMGWTQRLGDTSIDKNLYRHPSRQGLNPMWNYIMQHDIYSLGACLLEIGLWKSLIKYTTTESVRKSQGSDLLGSPTTVDDVKMAQHLGKQGKERLVSLAREELPQYMGDRYSEVVVTCLTCLDEDNMGFGNDTESQDAQGIPVGVRFIEKVSL